VFTRESNEQIEVRKAKLKEMKEAKIKIYQSGFKPDISSTEFNALYQPKEKEQLESNQTLHKMAGRIMAIRDFGKAGFIQVNDSKGRFQCYANKSKLNESFEIYKKYKDVGDIVYCEGTPMKTKTGEVSLKLTKFEILTKSLRPLPEKYHGIADIELKYRQRYLDMIMSEDSRNVFKTRSLIINLIRDYFIEKEFLEVETPMMHPLVGGAAAKPFETHHNTLDMDLYLRIAPELYLKRLLVGGFERVFEINRNFRNEGISIQHNPEFTMLEFYWAYATYQDLMDLTEDLFIKICKELNQGKDSLEYEGETIKFAAPWERITMRNSLTKYAQAGEDVLKDKDKIFQWLKGKDLDLKKVDPKDWELGELLTFAFEELVESKLIQPTFVTEYPTVVSPLSRKNENDPEIVDRFELFIYGREISNGFTELNDPDDQFDRFCEQAQSKEKGN